MGSLWFLIVIVLIFISIGTYLAHNKETEAWFATLRKPEWFPDSKIVSLAWLTFYIFTVYTWWYTTQFNTAYRTVITTLYLTVIWLRLGWIWSFYVYRDPVLGLYILGLSFLFAFWLAIVLFKVGRIIGPQKNHPSDFFWIMVVYMTWVLWAMFMMRKILHHNPQFLSSMSMTGKEGTYETDPESSVSMETNRGVTGASGFW